MNVWIFVISALFTPVVEPLGLSMEDATSAEFIQPTPGPTPGLTPGLTPGPALGLTTDPAALEDEPRYHGIERLLAELEAGQNR